MKTKHSMETGIAWVSIGTMWEPENRQNHFPHNHFLRILPCTKNHLRVLDSIGAFALAKQHALGVKRAYHGALRVVVW